jgi:hypothetical protein
MAEKARILVQLDTDALPSVFDRVVAIDAGAEHVLSYGGVTPQNVVPLVHGCIFTRGPHDLHRTAIFIGGSDVQAAEHLLTQVRQHLLPQYGLSVSILLDPNGANTTAAAAVRAAARHVDLSRARSLVLGGTGPVGQRVVRLLARAGGHVRVGSRQLERAEAVCRRIAAQVPGAGVQAVSVASAAEAPAALEGRQLVVAAGAPGVVLLPKKIRDTAGQSLQLLIDLNGVPPVGIEGVEPTDKGTLREGKVCYGALGIGSTKMKIHKRAIAKLFETNNAVLDIEEVYQLALHLD